MIERDESIHQRIDHNMTNHAPTDEDVIERFEALREFAKSFSHAIVSLCPDGRDRSLALTHAEDALMRAAAAVARDQYGDFEMGRGESPIKGEPPFSSAKDLEEIAAEALEPPVVLETMDAPEPATNDGESLNE